MSLQTAPEPAGRTRALVDKLNRARAVAEALPGTETFPQAKQRGEGAVVAAITSLAERDVARWSP